MSTPTPPPQPEPWKLPDPPAGQQWHRTDGWTADMLPSGFRPLLKGEREEIGDEWLNPRNYGWEKVKDVVNYTPDHYTDHRRTTRPLPPSAEAQPESANAVNVEEPPKSAGQAVKRELMRMQDTEWDSVAEAAIAWHLSHQPKPPSPEKRENPLEARGIHLSSKPEGKTKDGSIAVAQPSPPELKIEGWPSLEEFEREWPRSTIPGTLLYFIYMRVISLANARIEAAQFEKEQAINREAEKLAALLKVESERDTALEKVKEAEQAKNVEAERIMRIWSDCLGNMLYPKLHFIDALGKTTRRLNEDKTKALEEADKLRAELSRLTAATQQAQGGWISTAERMPTESDGGFHGEVLWAWDDARETAHYGCQFASMPSHWMHVPPLAASPPVRETEKKAFGHPPFWIGSWVMDKGDRACHEWEVEDHDEAGCFLRRPMPDGGYWKTYRRNKELKQITPSSPPAEAQEKPTPEPSVPQKGAHAIPPWAKDDSVLHNPDNLTPEQVGAEYRLLLKEEVDGRHEGKCDYWQRNMNEWSRYAGGTNLTMTYRVLASAPWPTPPSEGPAATEKCPHCFSTTKSQDGVSPPCPDPWHSSPPTETPKAWVPKFKMGDGVFTNRSGAPVRPAVIHEVFHETRTYSLRSSFGNLLEGEWKESELDVWKTGDQSAPTPESGAVPSDAESVAVLLFNAWANEMERLGATPPTSFVSLPHPCPLAWQAAARAVLAALKPAGEGEQGMTEEQLERAMPSRMVGSECNKSRLRWKERAEKAEKILAMQKEAEEGHPDMCCGQCHRLIAEARGEADSLRSRLEQAEKDRDGYRKGGELALADAVKAHAALKLAQETLQKSEFGKLQVEAERDKALEDLDALRGEVRRLREAIDSFNQNPT